MGPASIVDSPGLHSRYRICESTTHRELTDHLEIHLLDLRKLELDATLSPALRRWAEFFDHPTEETLRRLAEQDEIMAETIKKLEEVSADDQIRYLVEARQMGELQRRIYEGAAYEEGRQEGREEGRQEAREQARIAFVRTLVSVLESRFGEVPAGLRARVDSADLETLESWLPRAFKVSSLEAFFDG